MEKMLSRAGFETVSRAAFGRGRHCLPAILDDEKYEWESLYVEALKSRAGLELLIFGAPINLAGSLP
jgi:hypothetical protein